MEAFNQYVVAALSTCLLVLLACEMLARVLINTWYEIKHLLTTAKEDK